MKQKYLKDYCPIFYRGLRWRYIVADAELTIRDKTSWTFKVEIDWVILNEGSLCCVNSKNMVTSFFFELSKHIKSTCCPHMLISLGEIFDLGGKT